MLPLRTSVDLEAMAIKWGSAFSKTTASLESHHQIVLFHIQDTRRWGLPLCRGSFGVFYSPRQLDNRIFYEGFNKLLYGGKEAIHSEIELTIYWFMWYSPTSIISVTLLLRSKLVFYWPRYFSALCLSASSACLRDTVSFILPWYRKSRGTSHYTTQIEYLGGGFNISWGWI